MHVEAITRQDSYYAQPIHAQIGQAMLQFLDDLGEDINLIFAIDCPEDPDSEFTFLFEGTDFGIRFTDEEVIVVEFVDGEEEEIQYFGPERSNEAVLWLLTQVN